MHRSQLWKPTLRKAQKETNLVKLAILANQLEAAIFSRQQEFANYDRERTELVAAIQELYELRVKKLGFPDWRNHKRQ